MTQRWYMDPNNPDAAAYRTAHGIGGGGGNQNPPNTPAAPQGPNGIWNDVNNDASQWNDWAHQNVNRGNDFIQNSPFRQTAVDYNNDITSGNLNRNPFMQNVYNQTQGSSLTEPMDLIRQFLSGGGGMMGGGTTSAKGVGGGGMSRSYNANDPGYGAAGTVPDTVGHSDSFFAQHIRDLFDPARLDPMNDPTFAPFLAALRQSNQDNLMSSLADINASEEGAGRYGGSDWAAANAGARGQAIKSLDQSTAASAMAARQAALLAQQQGLDMTNTRDLGAMQDATQRMGIQSAANSAANASGAAAADAEQGRRLQAIQMMMQGNQFGLGLQSDMANVLQQGQLGSMGLGAQYDQLGLGGMNLDNNTAQLGLGALGLRNDAANGMGQYELGKGNLALGRGGLNLQRDQFNQSQMQGSFNNLLNMIQMIGGLGGDSSVTNPGTYMPTGMDPNMAALFGMFGGGMNAYGQGS